MGSVSAKDIATLTGKLVEQAYQQKLEVVGKHFGVEDAVYLPFDALTSTTFTLITGDWQEGVESPLIKGSAYVSYVFHYVLRKDLLAAFQTYLKEHSSSQQKFLAIDTGSIAFIKDSSSLSEGDFRKQGQVYIITTKMDVLQGYDFAQDGNHLLPLIKNLIVGLPVEDARKAISSRYEEVGSVGIKISPFWYQSIPTIKSRIKLQIF